MRRIGPWTRTLAHSNSLSRLTAASMSVQLPLPLQNLCSVSIARHLVRACKGLQMHSSYGRLLSELESRHV